MYKVLPFIVQFRRYSFVKNNHRFFAKFSYYQVSGTPFYYHVIKSILSEAELYADQDGA